MSQLHMRGHLLLWQVEPLVCWWWWCCNAFPVVGEVSQWPFSTLSWGPCTDLNGWFNLNLTTVTRLLAGIKQWTLLVSCIVQCFCMFCYSLSGTFPLACTLCLYSAGMPNSAPLFKVWVQCKGAVVSYIIICIWQELMLAKCFCKNPFCNFSKLRKLEI